jgi:hypothetical protein
MGVTPIPSFFKDHQWTEQGYLNLNYPSRAFFDPTQLGRTIYR